MSPCVPELLAHVDVVLKVVLCAVGVVDITCVADGAFADFVVFQNSIHGHTHVFDPVQAVEDTEHIHARRCGNANKLLHNVVRIVRVAHAVRAAQQHLRHQIGHGCTKVAQALPRAFLQEAVCHVKSRAAPAFDRKQLWQVGRIGRGCLDHVDRTHPCCQQALVAVPHGCVCNQQTLLLLHPVGHCLRAFLFQKVAGAHHRLRCGLRRARVAHMGGGPRMILRLGMTVDSDIRNIRQNLGTSVATA